MASMRRRVNGRALGLVALCVTVLIFALSTRQPVTKRPDVPMTGMSQPPSAIVSAPAIGIQESESTAPHLTRYGSMARLASKSPDLRRFVELAKSRPDEGGIAYAIAALERCVNEHRLRNIFDMQLRETATSDPSSALRKKALLNERERCSSFADEELLSVGELVQRGMREDPVVIVKSRLATMSSLKDRQELSLEIMSMRDPQLLARMPLLAEAANKQGTAPHLDGKPYGGVQSAEFFAAVNLLPCAFGEACDQGHEFVVRACVSYGICSDTTFDVYKKIHAKRPGSYENILSTFARLRDVIQSKDLNALSPDAESSNASVSRAASSNSSAVPPI